MADVYPESTTGSTKEDNSVDQNKEQESDSTASGYQAATAPNPFGPRPGIKTDLVSSSSYNSTVHLTPSRLSGNAGLKGGDPSSSDEEKSHRSSILAPSRLGMLNKTDVASPSKCLLRPSALSAQVQTLKQKDSQQEQKENQESVNQEKTPEATPGSFITKENYFATALTSAPDSTTDDGGGKNEFIFGTNLNERVTGVNTASPDSKRDSSESSKEFVFGQNLAERVVQSSTSPDDENKDKDLSDDEEAEAGKCIEKAKSLEESAREFQAKYERKTELKEVEIKTGEEGESNVLQATGKLFVFDSANQNWIERGRGSLRLNDLRSSSGMGTEFHSRLVMRTQGSLRVILNTKIWPGMTVEKASQKSLRITATDSDEGVKVFLINTSIKDSENIMRAVDWRIQQLRVREEADKPKFSEKRKADIDSSPDDASQKKSRVDEVPCIRREESDGSVLDPETEASSESCTSSSLTVRSESD
ncbi:ran-binding protein 3-like [Mytilus trossulus]|uniref:ran-binding protein 3-like n=1 Tax=Mytilus trossulus TaxID=6551 RepID=UPI0030071062